MGAAAVTQHPVGRNPDYGTHEFNTWTYVGGDASTNVIAALGTGYIHSVIVGVVGTLAKFYDTPAGGTVDDTTLILDVSLAAIGHVQNVKATFSRGLTVVISGTPTLTVTGRWSRGSTRTILRALPKVAL